MVLNMRDRKVKDVFLIKNRIDYLFLAYVYRASNMSQI
jgi:hypothetical protein